MQIKHEFRVHIKFSFNLTLNIGYKRVSLLLDAALMPNLLTQFYRFPTGRHFSRRTKENLPTVRSNQLASLPATALVNTESCSRTGCKIFV